MSKLKTFGMTNYSAAKLLSKCLAVVGFTLSASLVQAELGEPEKDELKFGFIKLTDMAPIAVAYENGYFEDEGLFVTIEAQANWKVLLDGVIDGKLDGAHMLAGQPAQNMKANRGYQQYPTRSLGRTALLKSW